MPLEAAEAEEARETNKSSPRRFLAPGPDRDLAMSAVWPLWSVTANSSAVAGLSEGRMA
ncbi:hypothetical protein AB0K49_07795 [Streptomyces decoyicus]|uniref:hypothetical protein n=1 Tax=Streptomyces decoyicus TaxID=249567 RepID=UPI00345CBE0B